MLRNRILAALILSVLVPAVYLVIDLRRASHEEVVAQFGAHQSLLARQAAHEVESYVKDCAQVLQFLSSFAAVQQRDRVRMAADFRAYLEPRKRLRNPTLSVYAEDGALVYSTDATDPVLNCSGADFFGWAKKTENQGKVFVSSRFWMGNEAGKPLPDRRFVLATPLSPAPPESPNLQATPSGRGVLLMTVDLEALLAGHLTAFGLKGKPNWAWILDRDGTVLLQSEHPEMVQNNIHRPEAQCLECHTSFDYARQMLVRRQGTLEYQLKEQPQKLAAFAPIEVANASWTLVVNVPYDEVTRFVRRDLTQTFLLLALMVVAFTALFGLVYRNYRLKVRAEEEARQWQEKHRLEEQARQAEARYRTLFEQSPDGVLVIDPETTRPIEFNETAHRQLGYSREEFARLRVSDYEARETPEETKRHVEQMVREGRADFETQHRTKPGELRDVEVIVQTLALAGRTVFHCIYRDITERKQAQQALAESETRLRMVVEASLDAILAVDERAHLVLFNAAAEELFGYPAQEVMDAPLSILLQESAAEVHQERVEKFMSRGVGQCGHIGRRMEQVFRRKNGSTFMAEVAMAGGRSNAKRLVVVSIHDITERKRAEEVLRESEERLRLAFATAQMESWDVDLTTGAVHESAGIRKLFGLPAGAPGVDVEAWKQRIHPDDRARVLAQFEATMRGETEDYPEYRVVWEDGSIHWVAGKGLLVRDTTGRPVRVIGIAMEITERKRAEAALRESEQLYRSLFENLLNGFAYCRMLFEQDRPQDFVYLDVNPAFEALTGLKQVVGRKASEVIPGIRESDPELFEIYGRVALTGVPERFETYVEALKMWFSVSVYSPQKECFVAVFDVITERKQAEATLRNSEAIYHSLVENLQQSVFRKDREGRFTFANQRFCDLVRRPLSGLAGLTDFDLFPRELAEKYRRDDQHVMAARQGLELEESNRAPDGTERLVQVVKTPLCDASGEVIGVQGIFWDITERKRAEEALRKSHEHFRRVIEDIFKFVPEALLVFTRNQNLYKQNKAFEDLVQTYAPKLNYTEPELREMLLKEIRAKVLSGGGGEIRIPPKNHDEQETGGPDHSGESAGPAAPQISGLA